MYQSFKLDRIARSGVQSWNIMAPNVMFTTGKGKWLMHEVYTYFFIKETDCKTLSYTSSSIDKAHIVGPFYFDRNLWFFFIGVLVLRHQHLRRFWFSIGAVSCRTIARNKNYLRRGQLSRMAHLPSWLFSALARTSARSGVVFCTSATPAVLSRILPLYPCWRSFSWHAQYFLASAICLYFELIKKIYLSDLSSLSSDYWVNVCWEADFYWQASVGYRYKLLLAMPGNLAPEAHTWEINAIDSSNAHKNTDCHAASLMKNKELSLWSLLAPLTNWR